MYESPITITMGEIQQQMTERNEELIMTAIQNVGVKVDKEELVKAIEYDRGQYEKGYTDAIKDAIKRLDGYLEANKKTVTDKSVFAYFEYPNKISVENIRRIIMGDYVNDRTEESNLSD